MDRSKLAHVVISCLLVGILGASLMGSAGAHVNSKFGHLWKEHIKPKLSKEGVVNTATNPIDWTQLKNVPAEIADGQDAVGEGGGGGDITAVEAGSGLTGGATSGDATLSVDTNAIQARVGGSCGATSAIGQVNANGTVQCNPLGAPKVHIVGSDVNTALVDTTAFTTLGSITELEVVDTPKTFLTTFSAESACTGSAGDWCSVQILVDGIPMIPDVGTNFAFDSANDGAETISSWESHSMQRMGFDVPPGEHIVTVQIRTTAGATFQLDDWLLTVLVI